MRLLFVHEHMGALGGAEVNILVTADELRRRGHEVALAGRESAGRDELARHEIFKERLLLDEPTDAGTVQSALDRFSPDFRVNSRSKKK